MYDSKQIDKEENYQVNQAKIAIAKGGLMGLGPGNSEQRNFLPHPYSDFIYAIIIEEYGLIGGAFIIFIYLVFLFRSIRIFQKMSVCVWCIPCAGAQLYTGDSGIDQYGGEREPVSGNRSNASAGEYGRKFIFVYLSCYRNHSKCGKKCGTIGRTNQ